MLKNLLMVIAMDDGWKMVAGWNDTDEEFVDGNSNGKWDEGEQYTDSNGNGKWDRADGNGVENLL